MQRLEDDLCEEDRLQGRDSHMGICQEQCYATIARAGSQVYGIAVSNES